MSEQTPRLEALFWSMPRPLRVAAAAGFDTACVPVTRLRAFAQAFHPQAYRIAGTCGGHHLSLLYAGRTEGAHHFSQRLGGRGLAPEPIGPASLDWLAGPLPAACGDPDLVVVEFDRAWTPVARRPDILIVPLWVGFELDLDPPGGFILPLTGNESLRTDLRALRRGDFRCVTTRDHAALDGFYREMYLPHLNARYGAAAKPSGRLWMRRLMERGVLIQVFHHDEFLGAGLTMRRGKTAYAMFVALRAAPGGQMPPGLSAAIYHYQIEWARRQGCTRLDFGHCRPFLNDGLARYKRKWGMRVKASRQVTTLLALQVRRQTPAVLQWLAQNPCAVIGKRGLTGWIFDDAPDALDRDRLAHLVRENALPGINAYRVTSPAGAVPGAAAAASAELGLDIRAAVLDGRWPPRQVAREWRE